MRRTPMWRTTHPRLVAASAALLLCATRAAADNLACNGTGMDWYTNMVGETPCQTYQKLRQICNSQYTVGVQNINTPPDSCSDQVSTCCCNTIAFSLSMLCLNCQQNIGTGSGFDAGVGAYQDYLGSCGNPQSFKLPTDIQTAVCNEKIKINNDIYSNGWGDGSWFYVFTRDSIIKDNIVANNNSFTHCASTTVNTSSSASGSSASASKSAQPSGTSSPDTSPPTTTKNNLASGAIAGIAVGAAIVGLAAAALLWWFCYYKKRHDRDSRRAGVLEDQFGGGGGGMRERPRDGRGGEVDESLVAQGYTYTSDEPGTATSDYFDAARSETGTRSEIGARSEAGTRSEGGTSSSAPGFAGLGAGYTTAAVGKGYGRGASDTSSTGPTSPRRGFHTSGQPSTSSNLSLPTHADAGGAASFSGSSGRQEGRRPQAGPLPRKRGAHSASNVQAGGSGTTPGAVRRDSAEPFLEEEEGRGHDDGWLDAAGDRHRDAGPVSDVSLGRSASGRLPPAYGEQI